MVYNTYEGGKGGYAKGTITLKRGDILYIQVGGQGTKTSKGYGDSLKKTVYGGYNGGGAGYVHSSGKSYCSAGGGATDIRINQDSLYARVIVAGGGSGRGYAYDDDDGNVIGTAYAGGGETSDGYNDTPDLRAGQTAGTYKNVFGVGEDALNRNSSTEYVCSSPGAGGGWYGGRANMAAGFISKSTLGATAGGSGYVYTSSSASNYPSGCLLNSSYYMTNTQNIVGSSSFPSTSGGTETGHSGNGYARITYEKVEQKILDEDVVLGFDYTGNVQTFVAPQNGTYTLEVWGASGGNFTMLGKETKYTGGKGGYAKGTVTLQKGDILYIQVGGRGTDATPVGWAYDNYKADPIENAGGYNGGGKAYSLYYSYGDGSYMPNISAAGGGATDIRINQDSLYARVIVAGGGSGSSDTANGYAGGGETSKGYSSAYYATQTSAGTNGSFGQGGNSGTQECNSPGGGGGWYGGGSYARKQLFL